MVKFAGSYVLNHVYALVAKIEAPKENTIPADKMNSKQINVFLVPVIEVFTNGV